GSLENEAKQDEGPRHCSTDSKRRRTSHSPRGRHRCIRISIRGRLRIRNRVIRPPGNIQPNRRRSLWSHFQSQGIHGDCIAVRSRPHYFWPELKRLQQNPSERILRSSVWTNLLDYFLSLRSLPSCAVRQDKLQLLSNHRQSVG